MISRRGLFAGLAALLVSPKLASGGVIPVENFPNVLTRFRGGGHLGWLKTFEGRALEDAVWRRLPKIYEQEHQDHITRFIRVFGGPCEVEDLWVDGEQVKFIKEAFEIPRESNKSEPDRAD